MTDREYSSGSVRRIYSTMPERLSGMISGTSNYVKKDNEEICRQTRKTRSMITNYGGLEGEQPVRKKREKIRQTIGRGFPIYATDTFSKAMVEMVDVMDAIRRLPSEQKIMIQMHQFGYSNDEIGESYGFSSDDIRFKLNRIFQKIARWCNGSEKPMDKGIEDIKFYLEKII